MNVSKKLNGTDIFDGRGDFMQLYNGTSIKLTKISYNDKSNKTHHSNVYNYTWAGLFDSSMQWGKDLNRELSA